MAGKRENHGATFKAQVPLAAHEGDRTVNQPAGPSSAHPTLIHAWKRFAVCPPLILMGLVGVAVAGYLVLHRYAYRSAMQAEMSYNFEQERLYANDERQLRNEIDAFQRATKSGRAGREMTDRLFEALQSSAVAADSREVERWRKEAESSERRTIALKWAKVAADEAAYKRELHRRWRRDHERNALPHHITDDEVKPFAMPEGWTGDDRKWGPADRDE